jgi:hypothetical protein
VLLLANLGKAIFGRDVENAWSVRLRHLSVRGTLH